jgi:hypothetical protein
MTPPAIGGFSSGELAWSGDPTLVVSVVSAEA